MSKRKKYTAEAISDYLYVKWRSLDEPEAMAGISYNTGQKGENFALELLSKSNPTWNFIKTKASKTPADIIGVRETRETLYISLIQVKMGTSKYLDSDFEEKETLKELVKLIFTYTINLKKLISVCTGFILIKNESMDIRCDYLTHNYRKLRTKNNPENRHIRTITKI